MDECAMVRKKFFIEEKSQRQISQETGFHRKTIKKIIEKGALSYCRSHASQKPVLGPFLEIIDAILQEDKTSPRKQRHTAKRIFERLKQEYSYTGGYTQVREYVRECKELKQQTYVPLEFGPGDAQVDWGEVVLEFEGELIKGHMFIMSLPWSNARFVACYPRETLEFFLEGHLRAFEFFGGVPQRIVYDNLKSAVSIVYRGRRRDLNETFQKFSKYYLFEPAFCNPRSGNEKGHVEQSVQTVRRNFFVPIPKIEDWDVFNTNLAEKCRRVQSEICRGHQRSIADRLAEQQAQFTPMPSAPFGNPILRKANKSCLVRFDTNDYSVPCKWAFHSLTLRADVAHVRIFHQDQLIAEHKRCHKKEQAIYDPVHYLPVMERKPRALDYGTPMKDLHLDPCFDQLRAKLEDGQEHSKGTRAFIRILGLLEQHSQKQLTDAVRRSLSLGVHDEETIRNLVLCPHEDVPEPLDLSERDHLDAYSFPPPPLQVYSALETGGPA